MLRQCILRLRVFISMHQLNYNYAGKWRERKATMNTLTDADKAYIAHLTGNSCHTNSWKLLQIYGADKVYGGTGAPTHLTLEEQAEHLEMWELQYQDPRWKAVRQHLVQKSKSCSICGSIDHLEVHHTVYLADKMLWEYDDNQLQVLCKKCHLKQHGLKVLLDGRIDRL